MLVEGANISFSVCRRVRHGFGGHGGGREGRWMIGQSGGALETTKLCHAIGEEALNSNASFTGMLSIAGHLSCFLFDLGAT